MKTAEQFTIDTAAQDRDALLGRLLESAAGMFNIFAVHIGGRLGFDRERAAAPLTAAELAARTHTHSPVRARMAGATDRRRHPKG